MAKNKRVVELTRQLQEAEQLVKKVNSPSKRKSEENKSNESEHKAQAKKAAPSPSTATSAAATSSNSVSHTRNFEAERCLVVWNLEARLHQWRLAIQNVTNILMLKPPEEIAKLGGKPMIREEDGVSLTPTHIMTLYRSMPVSANYRGHRPIEWKVVFKSAEAAQKVWKRYSKLKSLLGGENPYKMGMRLFVGHKQEEEEHEIEIRTSVAQQHSSTVATTAATTASQRIQPRAIASGQPTVQVKMEDPPPLEQQAATHAQQPCKGSTFSNSNDVRLYCENEGLTNKTMC